jgi:hypothetical protein
VIVAAAVLVLLAVLAWSIALLSSADNPDARSTAPPATSSPSPAPTSQPNQPSPAPTSQPSQPPPTTSAPAPNPPPQSPADTITAYYALMPADLPKAWAWLTPKYQQHPAGGYGGYQTFWARIRTVRVSAVNPLPNNMVEATIDYTFKDGRQMRERHRYTMINHNGRLLIDQSAVLSSQTL